eukprot:TCONS_00019318-protein
MSTAIFMLVFGLMLSFTHALNFDVFNSFILTDGINGAHKSPDIDNAVYFKKSHHGIVALPAIRDEFIEVMGTYNSFIMAFKMSPEPFHKGSIIWLEQKD